MIERDVDADGVGAGTPFEGCDSIIGVGFELALLLPGLMWLRRRRRLSHPE